MTHSTQLSRPRERFGASPRALIVSAAVVAAVTAVGLTALHAAPGMTTAGEIKILGVALAVGLDVLALSIAVGIMQIGWQSRIRLGLAFSAAEVIMQVAGYGLGTGAGAAVGTIATYAGFVVLAGVGVFIFRESYVGGESNVKVAEGWGLLAACASISLDSLGIGVSLPGVPLPLVPLLITVAVSTVLFTIIGLAFGSHLGRRWKVVAERCAGAALIVLAIVFTLGHVLGWAT